MNYQTSLINFSINGFKNITDKFELNGTHSHVLKNKLDNFFGPKPDFKLHRWAGSLKSSQALAYNLFSGMKSRTFEFDMWALDNDKIHKAFVDVAIETDNTVKLYEVKMFEIIHLGKNKIFHKLASQKYFNIDNYYWSKEVAKTFIPFLQEVQLLFKDEKVYGEGIKQLCCHLLGIINEMTIKDGKLYDKRVELFSLCFDFPINDKFKKDLLNYIKALSKFKILVDKYLKEIHMDSKIEFMGFLSLNEFLENNSELLGSANCKYISNRYLKTNVSK